MRNATVWGALLGVEKTVVEEVEFDEVEQVLVAHVRPRKRARGRCGRCGRPAPGYDAGEGRRRWRALDLGTIQAVVEADAPRVCCREHGPTVAAVPWARHAAGHTYAFDEQVAWLATQCSRSAVTQLMRIAWRTVGSIVARVWADVEALHDRFAGLARIGIDEISYKRGHRYLTVVVDIPWSTTRAGWCGPPRAGTGPPWRGSSTPSARTAARASPTSPRTARAGSRTWSPTGARARCAAPTRSTS